jgi:hypothetical protein
MTFVSEEDAIRFFVDEDPKVDAAYRNLRVAKSEAETLIMKHLGHLHAGQAVGGAVFRHRVLRLDGPLMARVTHFTIIGNLARVEFFSGSGVILTQEMTLTDLFPQIGGWVTDGPRPVDLA